MGLATIAFSGILIPLTIAMLVFVGCIIAAVIGVISVYIEWCVGLFSKKDEG